MEFVIRNSHAHHIDWVIGLLLVSRSGFMEQDALEVFHYYGFHLYSSFLSSPFRENNNEEVFPFPSHIFMPLANLWFIRHQGLFPILRTRNCSDLYPLIHFPGNPLAFGRGRILIPGSLLVPSYDRRLWDWWWLFLPLTS